MTWHSKSSRMASTPRNVLLQARDAGRSRLRTASLEEMVTEGPGGISMTTSDGRGAILLHPFRRVSKVTVQLSTHSSAPAGGCSAICTQFRPCPHMSLQNCRIFFHFKTRRLFLSSVYLAARVNAAGHRPVLLHRTFRSDDAGRRIETPGWKECSVQSLQQDLNVCD
jgi:hypothetical protein